MRVGELLFMSLLAVSGIVIFCSDKTATPSESPSLFERLQAMPGCAVEEITPPAGAHYSRAFQITIEQPVDHDNPGGATLPQRMFLSHVDESSPMVLVTWGYDIGRNVPFELADILQGNQLLVAYRYGGDNKPDPVTWEHLTVEQASGDYHRIAELLKGIYTGPWVNYGISNGGGAALHHRRFHPDDVQATVAVVAPVFLSTHDARVDEFLTNAVGTSQCRQRIRGLQRLALSRRDSLLPYYQAYEQSSGFSFTRIGGIEAAFEHSVLEYGYVFWQYFGEVQCDSIPDSTISNADLFAYLQRVSGVDYLHDDFCELLESSYYQFYTEIGYYGYVTEHVDDLLEVLQAPSFAFAAPQGVPLIYRAEVMQDIKQWLESDGQNIIYVYGGVDPNTAAAISPGSGTNSIRIDQPGGTHFQTILDLDQRSLVYDSLSSWLDIPLSEMSLQ